MTRRYFSFIASVLIFVMLVLSVGCGVRINGNEYELFSVDDKDKNGILNGIGSELSANQDLTEERQEAEKLIISSGVGDIEIKNSEDSKITIKANKKVKGATDESKSNILENMNVVLERDGKVINVVVKTKDGKDFWKWQNSNFKVHSPVIDFEISIPEGIKKVNIATGVGDIKANDITSELAISTGVGEINAHNVIALGKTELKTGTGDISFVGNVDDASSFEAKTGVGDVGFSVPEDTNMTLKVDTGVGSLSGSFIKVTGDLIFKFEGDINGGGPAINLKTGVGDIKADRN